MRGPRDTVPKGVGDQPGGSGNGRFDTGTFGTSSALGMSVGVGHERELSDMNVNKKNPSGSFEALDTWCLRVSWKQKNGSDVQQRNGNNR